MYLLVTRALTEGSPSNAPHEPNEATPTISKTFEVTVARGLPESPYQ